MHKVYVGRVDGQSRFVVRRRCSMEIRSSQVPRLNYWTGPAATPDKR